MRQTYWSSCSFLQSIIILSQTVWRSYGLHKISASGEITTSGRKWEMSLLHGTCLLFTSTKHYQNIRVSKLWSAQDFGFRGGNYKIKKESCLSCMWHAYWSSSSFLQNIIKICLRVSKLWSAQDICFRGDNYITKKKVSDVSLACDMPTGPSLNLYQILSYYLKQYACTRFLLQGDNYITKKMRVVSLARDMPTGSLLLPYQILSNYLKQCELWPAQDFGFRGDNYITTTLRVVILASNIPTGPLFYFY